MKFEHFKTEAFTYAANTICPVTLYNVFASKNGEEWEQIAVMNGNNFERDLENIKKNANADFQSIEDIIKLCKISTQERYWDMLECLPPMYFRTINGFPIQQGFFCTEPTTHNEKGGVYGGMFTYEGIFYAFDGNATSLQGKQIEDSYEYEFSNVKAFFTYY